MEIKKNKTDLIYIIIHCWLAYVFFSMKLTEIKIDKSKLIRYQAFNDII